MYIRWLVAFRKNGSIGEGISFELSHATDVACEQLQGENLCKGRIPWRPERSDWKGYKALEDDIQVEYLVTWYHCHLDDVDNYVAGTESPYIEMRSVSEDSLRFAREALMRAGLIYGD